MNPEITSKFIHLSLSENENKLHFFGKFSKIVVDKFLEKILDESLVIFRDEFYEKLLVFLE